MKRMLLLVVALLMAGTAWGQADYDGGQKSSKLGGRAVGGYDADSLFRAMEFDASGHLKTSEQAPLTTGMTTWQLLDGSLTTLASAAGDSCAPFATNGVKLYSITVKCVAQSGGVGSLGEVRLAIQLRKNIDGSADSLRTSAFYPLYSMDNSAAAALADTINAGHLRSGSTSTPWSGEFVLTFDGTRLGPNGTSALFFYPNAQTHLLGNLYGSPLVTEYASMRVRNLSITSAPTVRVWVWVTGTPL